MPVARGDGDGSAYHLYLIHKIIYGVGGGGAVPEYLNYQGAISYIAPVPEYIYCLGEVPEYVTGGKTDNFTCL